MRRAVRAAWLHRSAIDHPEWLATAADFAVIGDDRLTFTTPPDRPAREVVDAWCGSGLYPPALPVPVREQVAARHEADGRRPFGLALRRLVCRR